ncbi:MAG TPA: hypothetical protein VE967_05910 [Gemmatimonadaceae bacterium]|nr:hypothetical protein [Gemmatimonadaceae bacterium]
MAQSGVVYESSDGLRWRVDVRNPGSSNALVVFTHPDPQRTRENRYANYVWKGVESQNVSGRIDPQAVLRSLDSEALNRLFRRSMPMTGRPTIGGRPV